MNFYEVLGVDPDAERTEIRLAYRERARRFHPDVNEHPAAGDQFRVLTRARTVLTDPEERSAYDRLGHDGYVEQRIDGDFPAPEMVPRPSDGSGLAGGVAGTGQHGGVPGRTVDDPEPSTEHGGDHRPTEAGRAGGGGQEDSDGDEGASTDESPPDARSPEAHTGSDARFSGVQTGSHTTPPTPGPQGSSRRTHPRGPRRIDRRRSTAESGESVADRLVGHLTASTRWIGVVVAAAVYFAGLIGYLETYGAGVDAFARALTSSDPVAVAGALRDERYGVPYVTAFPDEVGLLVEGTPSDALLLFAGVVLLPASLALAVTELRGETTWRPSWLHVTGALAPAGAVALPPVVSRYPDAIPIAAIPLLADLLLLVVFPGVVVASFLVNRLLVVLPLRRREDLGAP